MPALHISPKNPHKHKEFINTLKNAPIAFILVYMEGCGPCGEVRPKWGQLCNDPFLLNTLDPRVVMADIDHTVLANKDFLKDPPSAFPNIRFITSTSSDPSKQMYEEYNGPRTSEDIKNWIKTSLKSSLGKTSLGRRSSSGRTSLEKRSSLSNKSPSSFHSLSHSSNSSSHSLSNRHNSNSLRGGSSFRGGSSLFRGGSLFKFKGSIKTKRRKNKKSKKNK